MGVEDVENGTIGERKKNFSPSGENGKEPILGIPDTPQRSPQLFSKRALMLQAGVLAPQTGQLARVASLLATSAMLFHPSRQQTLGEPQLLADLYLRQLRSQNEHNSLRLELGFETSTLRHGRGLPPPQLVMLTNCLRKCHELHPQPPEVARSGTLFLILTVLHQLRLERAVAVPLNLQQYRSQIGDHCLRVAASAHDARDAFLWIRILNVHPHLKYRFPARGAAPRKARCRGLDLQDPRPW